MSEVEQALELDPLNFFTQCFFGWHLLYACRSDAAIAQIRKAIKMEPNFPAAHLGLWGAFYRKQMYQEAQTEAQKFFGLLGDSKTEKAIARGWKEAGYPGAMRLAAEELVERSCQTHVPAVRIARLYAHAGDRDSSLEMLEKTYQDREPPLVHLSVGWDWHDLRDDPRFQDLLQCMSLPEK